MRQGTRGGSEGSGELSPWQSASPLPVPAVLAPRLFARIAARLGSQPRERLPPLLTPLQRRQQRKGWAAHVRAAAQGQAGSSSSGGGGGGESGGAEPEHAKVGTYASYTEK